MSNIHVAPDIHIPDVAGMYGRLDMAKQKLNKIIANYRELIRSKAAPDSELKDMFYGAGVDEEIKAGLAELSICLDDAQNLINVIRSGNAKRGRKFQHFQRMLEQDIAKVHKVYGKLLEKYSLWTESGGLWTDISD
jgi:hypothetical protein